MKIGVFDSGVGGKSVANAIKKALLEHEILYRQDRKNVPYGTKSSEELYHLVQPILQQLVMDGCAVIVVACNSVTTTIIDDLRKAILVPLIGIEPMVKPAATITKTGVITVCATPATLQSARYQQLKDMYAPTLQILEPDCSQWAAMIERNVIDKAIIRDVVEESIQRNSDVIVMGCTHYHWIDKTVERIARNRAVVLQPERPVIRQLKRVISQLD